MCWVLVRAGAPSTQRSTRTVRRDTIARDEWLVAGHGSRVALWGSSGVDHAGEPDDDALAATCLAGEEAAFETLVLRHRRSVAAISSRYFFNPADIEDVSQEAFVRARNSLARRKPGAPFAYWLLRITINCCLDTLRHRARHPAVAVSRLTPDESAWVDRHLAARSEEQHQALERAREARALLERVLARVAPKDRTVLYLLYAEEMAVEDIARVLGWSKTLVKVRAFRARRVLRKALEELAAHERIPHEEQTPR